MIRAASACIARVGRSRPGKLSRAFQQASQFSAVWVSSSLKRFVAIARCSRVPEAQFMHTRGKGVVKRTDRKSGRPGGECSDRNARHKTLFEAGEGEADRNSQAYDDRLDLSYTNDGD